MKRRLDAFQKLALITTITTYLLILVGGLVRASGAGLGCPDWPKCFGLLIPPTRAEQLPPGWDPALFNVTHTWTEFLNRLLGATVGILILATLIAAIAKHRRHMLVLVPTFGAFAGVLYAAWLGKVVIATGLEPWMVTAHLLVAILVVSLLLFATAQAFLTEQKARPHKVVFFGGIAVIALTLVQAALGTQVRHAVELNRRLAPDDERGAWLAAVGRLDLTHRQLAVVLFFLTIALLWKVRKDAPNSWLERAITASLILCAAQMGTGLALAYVDLPPAMQVAHLALGSLVLGAQTLFCILAGYGTRSRLS